MTKKEREFLEGKVIITAEAARILGKDISQVSRDARAGRLPAVHKASGYLFIREDIESIKMGK